ncbi:MAG: hypothetical protein VXY81_12760, partial [Pseudomonadota bacterium]|nr:hypothetical protein [Pseudomonadota bacterium]
HRPGWWPSAGAEGRAGAAAGPMARRDAQRRRGAAAGGAGRRVIQGLADEGPCCFPKGDRPAAWNAARLTGAGL